MNNVVKNHSVVDELQGKGAYLQGLTEKIIDATRTIDNHANVMVGINMAIVVLIISMLFDVNHLKLTMGVVAIFSALSAISAVFAIRLPHALSSQKHPESLFYARKIASFDCADDYAHVLRKTITNDDDLFREYAREAYNLSKYYYIPKRRMLTCSRYLFLFGVMSSSLFLLLEKLHWFVL